MTFKEEALKSRSLLRRLRLENSQVHRSNDLLRKKVLLLEKVNQELTKENKRLKQEQILLRSKQQQQEKRIESLSLIVEELRSMVFGKRKKKDDSQDTKGGSDNGSQPDATHGTKRKSANRAKESYRRAAPAEEDITDSIDHPLTHCPDCGTLLIRLKHIIRYTEDLATLTELAQLLKKIEKHIIRSGYCPHCKKRKNAQAIAPQVSILGENVKQFVCYLSIVMRLSFEQIRCFLSDTARLSLSDGEITSCLDGQAAKLTLEKERLFAKIRGAPGRHYDETGWPVQKEDFGNYAWITRPTIGEETIFLMGRSRGIGNAKELQGEVDNQVGISDDYAAYDNLFQDHQLCMGHPQRKLRDLHESKTLSPTNRVNCTTTYGYFSKLYASLQETLATEYEKDLWLQKRDEYINRLKEISVVRKNDPQKLRTIKESLAQNTEKYFTCLLKPGIPSDNNKAERGLRHIVLKRKISYGSKSQKGADTMGILCSTLLSCWWNKPDNFFVAYKQMLTT